jgi:hypothetical protein
MTTSNNLTIYKQHLTVILWRPGDYQTPETVVEFQQPNSTDKQQVFAQPAYFAVKTTFDPDDPNLRPLKSPISVFYVSPLWIGALITALATAGGLLWKQREKIVIVSGIPRQTGNLHESANAAMIELKQAEECKFPPPKVYAVVSEALRRYIHGRFNVRAQDMTTAELVEQLHNHSELSARRQRELAHLLEQADLVKFARLQPQANSAQKILNVAQRWVMAIEQEQAEAAE